MTAPEKLSIDTPEQVALEFPLAGVGSRFLALAADTLIQAVVGGVIVLLALLAWRVVPTAAGSGPWAAAAAVLALFTIYYGYFAGFEAAWQGQTPGKRLVGLRVIGASGRPARLDQVLIRNLLRIADQLPAFYAIGIASVLLTARHQRLGDLAAGTVVVHERPIEAEGVDYDAPARGAGAPVRLSDAEAVLIEAFLRRRREVDVFVREQRAREIASRLRARLRLEAAEADDEALLERLIDEHRGRGRYR